MTVLRKVDCCPKKLLNLFKFTFPIPYPNNIPLKSLEGIFALVIPMYKCYPFGEKLGESNFSVMWESRKSLSWEDSDFRVGWRNAV